VALPAIALAAADVNGAYIMIGTSPMASFLDTGLPTNTSFLYGIEAVDALNFATAVSQADLATTIVFTDDPVVPSSTVIKAAHILELRTAANAVRALNGDPPATFTGTIAPGGTVKMTHVYEARQTLNAAREALGIRPAYFIANDFGYFLTIRAVHVEAARSLAK